MERLQWAFITSDCRIPNTNKEHNFKSLRSEIESDYHRIIRSASFRRLQDKTQVFPLDKSDFVRTRLTHSLEVSSIAKLLGKQVCAKIYDLHLETSEHLPNPLDVIEILNCAGLLHDIGNPPFGHFGETAIRGWFHENLSKATLAKKPLCEYLTIAQMADFTNYEGNAQALRVISKLHRLSGNHGMHLTSAVMDAIIKYPTDAYQMLEEKKLPKEKRSLLRKKFNYFQSEKDVYEQIKENTKCFDCRNPLTFLLEAADDVAYTFADLEDGFKKGCYRYEDLVEVLQRCHDEKGADSLSQQLTYAKALMEEKEKGFDPYDYAIINWLTLKQLYCISEASNAFIAHYDEIMRGTFAQELLHVSTQGDVIAALKAFAYKKIYNIAPILKLELMGNEILTFLLDRFMQALIVYDTKEPMSEIQEKYIDLISRNYLDTYQRSVQGMDDEGERLYHRLLLGCDFIAGMSDSYAKDLYQQLKGI